MSAWMQDIGEDQASVVKSSINELLTKASIALHPFLSNACEIQLGGTLSETLESSLFQIIGFDVLIDDDGKAWLLEINNCPSMNISFETGFMGNKTSEPSPIDHEIKYPLMRGSLVIAGKHRRKGDEWI